MKRSCRQYCSNGPENYIFELLRDISNSAISPWSGNEKPTALLIMIITFITTILINSNIAKAVNKYANAQYLHEPTLSHKIIYGIEQYLFGPPMYAFDKFPLANSDNVLL